MGEEHEHGGDDSRFDHSKEEAVDEEQPEPGDDALCGGEDAPENERPKHQLLHAAAFGKSRSRDLEHKVAEEEEASEEAGFSRGDVEGTLEASGGSE